MSQSWLPMPLTCVLLVSRLSKSLENAVDIAFQQMRDFYTCSNSGQRDVSLPQCANHQKYANVGRRIIYCNRGVGNGNSCGDGLSVRIISLPMVPGKRQRWKCSSFLVKQSFEWVLLILIYLCVNKQRHRYCRTRHHYGICTPGNPAAPI